MKRSRAREPTGRLARGQEAINGSAETRTRFPFADMSSLGQMARLAKPGFLGEPFVIGLAD